VSTLPAQDGHGHGTHCAGLACGPRTAASGRPAYGVADRAQLIVGRVLDDYNSGVDGDVIAGLEWAASRGADVIALCLSAMTAPDIPPSIVYEHIARQLLMRGQLVLAAAGEDDRRLSIGPVQHPANCNSIVALGMLGINGDPHSRSPGLAPGGDPIDLCAPGENIFSAALSPMHYTLRSGTSMATALTAGVAALWAGTDSKLRGLALWEKLTSSAVSLPNFRKAGLGLVQAPQ
jgi:subtilisin